MSLISLYNLGNNFSTILDAAINDPPHDHPQEATKEEICSHLYQGFIFDGVNYDRNGPYVLANVSWRKRDRIAAIWRVFEDMHRHFHSYLLLLKEHLAKYENYLTYKCQRFAIDETDIKNNTRFILEFYNNTHEFFQLTKTRNYWRLLALFKTIFCADCFRLYDKTERYYFVITMEARIGKNIPYRSIVEVSFEQEPSQVIEWNEFVQDCIHSGISSDDLHRGLTAILKLVYEKQIVKGLQLKPSSSYLEHFMEETKKNQDEKQRKVSKDLLTQQSKPHLEWRDQLAEGSIITSTIATPQEEGSDTYCLNIHQVTLGKRIGKKENDFDYNHYYEIAKYTISKRFFTLGEETLEDYLEIPDPSTEEEQDPSQLLVFVGINEAITGMKFQRSKRPHFLRHFAFRFFDKEGKFAIVEKLCNQIAGPEWEDSIKKTDYQRIVANVVKHCVKKKIMPSPFQCKYFMFNSNSDPSQVDLRTVKALDVHPLDYIELEKFIYEASMSDKDIFKKIMAQARLKQDQDAEFLRKAVLESFNSEYDAASMTENDALIKTATQLRIQMQTLYRQACDIIKYETKKELNTDQREEISHILLKLYESSNAITLMWPTLVSDTVKIFKEQA